MVHDDARAAMKRRRSTLSNFLPKHVSMLESFQLAADAGFDGIELESVATDRESDEALEAARRTGLRIHSVKTTVQCSHPFTGPSPERAIQATERAIRNAKHWGAQTVLTIPGFVTREVSYASAYERSLRVLRDRVLPLAEENQVILAIENCWRDFFLGPSDMIRFIDALGSPFARAYLDVGNLIWGFPEHWIRELGPRIVQIHAKDFALDVKTGTFAFRDLGDGAIDWAAVKRALDEIGFAGWIVNTALYDKTGMARRVQRGLTRRLGLPEAPWRIYRRRLLRDLQHRARRIDETLGDGARSHDGH